MNTIIALKGRRKIGKTQTIRTVDELLRAKYPDAIIEHERILNVNGARIGIESQDDPNGRLIKHSLRLFVNRGCQIIICATRTSGGTFNAVDALAGYEAIWLEQRTQSLPFEQVLSNLAMAGHIVEETGRAIAAARPVVLSRAAGGRP